MGFFSCVIGAAASGCIWQNSLLVKKEIKEDGVSLLGEGQVVMGKARVYTELQSHDGQSGREGNNCLVSEQIG